MSNTAVAERSAPVWDLSSYFTEFNGAEMRDFKQRITADFEALAARVAALETLCGANAQEWEACLAAFEDVMVRYAHLSSFVGNLAAADATNEAYAAESAALGKYAAASAKVEVDLMRSLRDCTEADFNALLARPGIAAAQYFLTRLRTKAQKTMPPAEEKLAADLAVDGIGAWDRLYDNITGRLEFEMHWPEGKVESLPISRWRSLMGDPDRSIGRAAFEGGNRAWARIEVPCAAALNAIGGWRLTLNKRRGWDQILDVAVFQAGISRQTLDAMYEAIHATIDIPREYYRIKARATGRKAVWFYEREAPLPGESSGQRDWEAGSAMVERAFDAVYPAIGNYYRDFLAKRWLEAEARGGKRPGAYCTGSPLTREQRVYMTYNGTLGDIGTIAHEIGHAWHSHLLREMRPVARRYPMTLAETASIFAEHVLARGVEQDPAADDALKLALLDESLSGAAIILLDIAVRYEFEKAFYAEREQGELPVSRLKELMSETQERIWGDCLDPAGVDPYFWASKLHFYISDAVFYNYPYTFGHLMARAFDLRLMQEGPGMLAKYEDFLRLSGSDTAENVVKRTLGEDITQPAFWRSALESLAPDLAKLKQLLGQ